MFRSGAGQVGGPPCPVSGTHGPTRFDFERDGLRVYRCRACGTFVTDARYDGGSYASRGGPAETTADELLARRGYRWGLILEAVRACCPPPARVFDVGAGSGGFLYLASQRGYEVDGTTMSQGDVEYARDVLGVRLGLGGYESLGEGDYDLVASVSVIEHVDDPAALMSKMVALTRPGGFVSVTTPNPNAYGRLLLGSRRWQMFRSEHLHILSMKGLQKLARAHGLEVLSHTTESMRPRGLERAFGPMAPAARRVIGGAIRAAGVGGDQILVARRVR